MAQSPQFLLRCTRLFRPRVEPLEDRLLLAHTTLPDLSSGDFARHSVTSAGSLNPETVGSQPAPPSQGANGLDLNAGARDDLDDDRRIDHREAEAGERVLAATLSAYLPTLNQESHTAPASPVQNGTPLATSPPESVESATYAAPGVVERLAILALRSREPELADSADRGPNPNAAQQLRGSTEVAENQVPPPSPGGDPPSAEPVPTAALPLDTPAIDLAAMKREVDGFFARLADLGQTEGINLSLPLVPTVLVATALAYEFNRRWRMKRTVTALPGENFILNLPGDES